MNSKKETNESWKKGEELLDIIDAGEEQKAKDKYGNPRSDLVQPSDLDAGEDLARLECQSLPTEGGATSVTIPGGIQVEIQAFPSSQSSTNLTAVPAAPGAYAVVGPNASEYETSTVAVDNAEPRAVEHTAVDHNEPLSAELCLSTELDQDSVVSCYEIDPNEGGNSPGGTRKGNQKGWLAVAAIGFFGGIVLLIVFSLIFRSPEENESPQLEPVDSKASDENVPFSNDLPPLVISSIENDQNSPFYKANLWLLQDPNQTHYSLARQKQRFYLAMLFYATDGDKWSNNEHWLSYDVSECNWFSSSSYPKDSPYFEQTLCDEDGTFINLSLASNNLSGSMPIWYTSFLPYLRVLDLSSNKIGGQVPPITTSEHLEVWNFSNTNLSGKLIVNAMGIYDSLRILEWVDMKIVADNGGAVYYVTPNLERYHVSGVDAPLYSTIGLLTNLHYLDFGDNPAHGTIPSELGLLSELAHLDLSHAPNFLGALPSELGLLTKLTHLDLRATPVTGSVPVSVCTQISLRALDFSANCSLLECCQ